jgi:hypothetical protein
MVNGSLNYNIPSSRQAIIRYQYERSGFGHVKYPGLDSYYGLTLSEPAWVMRQIAKLHDIRLVHFAERAWGAFHDVFACVRDPDWQMQHERISSFTYFRHQGRERLMKLARLCFHTGHTD